MSILSCENVGYHEDGLCLFDDVSFRLDSGQRGVVVAEPHRSATVLLKICATLLSPTSGQVSWFGYSAKQMGKREFYGLRRRIGLVHRETSLISNMTILDNVSLGLQYHKELSQEAAYERVTEWLKHFEIYEDRMLRPAELTFEQRRLAVYARELAKEPQLILLEHPSLDLGERVYGMLLEVFKTCSLDNGCAFLVSSVMPEIVDRWADWVLVFDEGRCKHMEVNQFDPAEYRESMRRQGARLSRKRRNE